MRVSRFYQEGVIKAGDELDLTQANHRHAVQVLRLKVGDSLIIFNGIAGEYSAKISATDKRNSKVVIEDYDPVDRESSLDLRKPIEKKKIYRSIQFARRCRSIRTCSAPAGPAE